MRKQILFVLFSLATLSIHADEGMWMLTDLKTQNAVAMRELGLEIPIEEVYDANGLSLKDAVVHFGGGCTGEIISSEGLVLTNHHCGYGAIQQHSNVEHDYLTDGFWAMNRDTELPTPGLTVTFIDRILDVTDYVNEQLKKDPDPEGVNYLSPSYLGTVAERFAKAENIEITPATKLELKAFYGGNKYYMFIKTVYSDIRMVGAPPSSIGKFGADTDNWMWPRHTGDFSNNSLASLLRNVLLNDSDSVISLAAILKFTISVMSSMRSINVNFSPGVGNSLSLEVAQNPSVR